MNFKTIVLFLFLLYCNIDLKSQPILLNNKNTPKAEYTYVFKNIAFEYSKAIHSGADTIWDFSDIEILNDSTYNYYTHDSDYISFPGHEYTSATPPDPTDTTYLRSNNAIFRITDTLFYQAYSVVYVPFPCYCTFIDNVVIPLLKFPFQYNSIIGSNWKKADAYGTVIFSDSSVNMLRVTTHETHYQQTGNHSHITDTVDTYEWYADNSELPFIRVVTIGRYEYDFGGPPIPSYDTIAWLFTAKIYNPPLIPEADSVAVFPSPAFDWVYLKTFFDVDRLSIYNIEGRLVNELFNLPGKTKHPINIINLEKGIYILRGELSNGKTFYKKIFVGN